MKNLLSLFTFLLSTGSLFAHSYYVSTSNMEYNAQTETIDVSIKTTAHDFEHILETKYNLRIHIETIADSSEIGLYIQAYLSENFTIKSNDVQATMKYIGKEVTLRDELFFFISFSGLKNPKTIQIKNTLLFTEFTQQQNIVHYKLGDLSKSVTLVASKPEAELKFE
ncbi:MAG: hypothetical protein IPO32_15330 [Crocinitomicaceae bacterium]|jgi:hypothetical protein|nr:hypothetical protein [Crocinitomicaceae bacterium]